MPTQGAAKLPDIPVTQAHHDAHAGAQGLHQIERENPENRQLAQQVFDNAKVVAQQFQTLDGARKAGYTGQPKPGDRWLHVRNGKHVGGDVDLKHPGQLVYYRQNDGTWKLAGLVYTGKPGTVPDLGMGTFHQHDPGRPPMQHVWLTDRLETAFSHLRPTKYLQANDKVGG